MFSLLNWQFLKDNINKINICIHTVYEALLDIGEQTQDPCLSRENRGK